MNIKKFTTVLILLFLSAILFSQQVEKIYPFSNEDTTGVYIILDGKIQFEQNIQESNSLVNLIFPNTKLTNGNFRKWVDLPPLYQIEAQETINNQYYKHTRVNLYFNEIPEFKINNIGENILQIIWLTQKSSTQEEQVTGVRIEKPEVEIWSNFDNKVSLNLKNAELTDVLRLIAIQNDMNVVANSDIIGKATVSLKDVSVGTALDALLKVNNYNWFIQDNLIIVSPMDDEIVGGLITKHYKLKYVDAFSVGTALEHVLTEKGDFQLFSPVASSSYFGNMGGMNNQGGGMGRSGGVGGGIGGGTMGGVGGGIGGGTMGGVGGMMGGASAGGGMQGMSSMMSADHILVTDVYSNFDHIDKVINEIDIRVKQINIAVKFIETKLDVNERLGLDWSVRSELIGPVPQPDATISDFDNFRLFDSGNLSLYAFSLPAFESVLEMLASDGETRLIQEPQLTTKNNSVATFKVGTTYPVLVTQTTDYSQITSYDDKEISISLMVQPRINEETHVSLDISATVQALVGFAGPNNDHPIISDRSSTTHVRIEDQKTLMIGGLIYDHAIENKSRLPILSSIPILGKLFTHSNYAIEQRELLIFITPSVIHN